ncbi:Gfo/Idh/MocA family oxidoreductase [Microbacterium sp. LTA6]|uniref:Gfo/Idh/MocA family protein n=1 Tax=unclassified Microbacterium TaxID=2609290 RepID=UPI0031398518
MSPQDPLRVGIVGAGVISSEYLENLTAFPGLDVAFVADLDLERAREQAQAHRVRASGSVDDLLSRDEIDLVVNLTIPAAHVAVTRAALHAGKHVWVEKPFALDLASGRSLLDEAHRLGLRIGSAPDTFLGAGLQTALRTIAADGIGTPLTALAVMQSPGPDLWHPHPEFLFQEGAGPLFDIGPYYFTALVQALGPARRVMATSATARPIRTVRSGPRAGTEFPVTVPTHHGGLIEFEGGASAQFLLSFQSHLKRAGVLEIAGTHGTLVLPDPNAFHGDSTLYDDAHPSGKIIAASGVTSTRGIGVAELAQSIRDGRRARASGEQALHVLDIMSAIAESADERRPVLVESTCEPQMALPETWDPRRPR